eukprot:6181841-Amphidinium_carterae.1
MQLGRACGVRQESTSLSQAGGARSSTASAVASHTCPGTWWSLSHCPPSSHSTRLKSSSALVSAAS